VIFKAEKEGFSGKTTIGLNTKPDAHNFSMSSYEGVLEFRVVKDAVRERAFAAHAERLRTWNIASSFCRLKDVPCTWTLIVKRRALPVDEHQVEPSMPQWGALGAEFRSGKYENTLIVSEELRMGV
jgi:hypothetical protein